MKIIKKNIFRLIKFFLQIGILVLFIGIFFKIFLTLPSYLLIKLIFILTYIWFTIGINVNLIIPLIKQIESDIN